MTTDIASRIVLIKVSTWERMKMLSKMGSTTIKASGYNSIEAALMDTMLNSIKEIEKILKDYERENPD